MQGWMRISKFWMVLVVVGLASLYGGQGISAYAGGDASQSFQSSVFSDQCFAPLEFELDDFRSPVDGDVVTDGHGSVRGVTGSNGLVEEEFDYDAFPPRRAGGVLLGAREWDDVSGQMVGVAEPLRDGYFYSGERWDSDLGMYYLRARYLNAGSGRFHTMDDYEGRRGEPMTLHKYLYAHSNPVSYLDPSGRFKIVEAAQTFSLQIQITAMNVVSSVGFKVVTGSLTAIMFALDPAGSYYEFKDSVAALGPLGFAEGLRRVSFQRVTSLKKLLPFYNKSLGIGERGKEFAEAAAIVKKTLRNTKKGRNATLAYGEFEGVGQVDDIMAISGKNNVGTTQLPKPLSTTSGGDFHAEEKVLQAMAESLKSNQIGSGKLRIWIDNLACQRCKTGLGPIRDFKRQFPGVELEIVEVPR